MGTGNHIPQRTCLGCGGKDEQRNLLRLILGPHGELQVDASGCGRGGYLHYRRECWPAFLRRKNTHRAFRMEITKGAKETFIQRLNDEYRE
ncbi:MAG: YlxR family protein [Candidatus Binatia bacterium]